MADEGKEQKWSCGCHVVDGKLAQECTQTRPNGEISAERHGVSKPFAAKCGRLAEIAHKAAEAKAAADAKATKEAAEKVAIQAAEDEKRATPATA